MTMREAIVLSDTDGLYGLDPDEKHPVLATDEYDVSYKRHRCYVVITSVRESQWANMHVDRGANSADINKAYKIALEATQALCDLARTCKDSSKWQVLSLSELQVINCNAYSDIPHLREPMEENWL